MQRFGMEKDLKRALELFREMPREGVPYNTSTYLIRRIFAVLSFKVGQVQMP